MCQARVNEPKEGKLGKTDSAKLLPSTANDANKMVENLICHLLILHEEISIHFKFVDDILPAPACKWKSFVLHHLPPSM